MTSVSLSSMNRIVKTLDPEIRIGKGAKEELRMSVEEYAARVSELAIKTARSANRNTVLQQDISTAREQLMVGIKFHQSHTSGK